MVGAESGLDCGEKRMDKRVGDGWGKDGLCGGNEDKLCGGGECE